jgi:hypothetical protein
VTIAFTKGKHPLIDKLGYPIAYKRATGINWTAVRKMRKMELFLMDSVPELTTKNIGSSPIFLIITHMTLFAMWFTG